MNQLYETMHYQGAGSRGEEDSGFVCVHSVIGQTYMTSTSKTNVV